MPAFVNFRVLNFCDKITNTYIIGNFIQEFVIRYTVVNSKLIH